MGRGGKRPRAGRPKELEHKEKTTIYLGGFKEVFMRLGGSKWLRAYLSSIERGENKKR